MFKPKSKFNFLADRKTPAEVPNNDAGSDRVRAFAKDKFAGLRGHDYIEARQLNAPIPLQTSAHKGAWK